MNALDNAASNGKAYEIDKLSGRMVEVLHAIGQVTGEVHKLAGATINITNNLAIMSSPLFTELQAGLLEVCARHPEARSDIVNLFHRLDAKHSAQHRLIEAKVVADA